MELFENVTRNLLKVAEVMGLSKEELLLLNSPKRIVQVTFPVRMDSGERRLFTAYRVQFNDARGPAKGGIRFHHQVDMSEVKSLAFWMAIKCAVANIPYGGGKGGVVVDPKTLSGRELEAVSRGFVRSMHQVIGPDIDIPAPDVYTNPQVMAWMLDEYETITGHHRPGVITGKPLALGGSKVRDIATALGGTYVLHEWARQRGLNPKQLTVAVQGFGNAGMVAAQLLHEQGLKVIAVSDSKGGIFNEKGLDIPEVVITKQQGSVQDYSKGQRITNEQLLELQADVLIPAALSDAITAANATNVKAKAILELANGPLSPEADDLLFAKGVDVLPDVLANAGGVIVSYFEWVQNNQGYYWSEEEVKERLDRILKHAFKEIDEMRRLKKVDYRTAAYIIATKRILEAERLRGNV
ncbi:MAG: Glu/Leu/Phe/Val dehydrogenase [Nanoarchaeota archaeon]